MALHQRRHILVEITEISKISKNFEESCCWWTSKGTTGVSFLPATCAVPMYVWLVHALTCQSHDQQLGRKKSISNMYGEVEVFKLRT
eukprot:5721717-Pleurochrysis_carterae.AAC.3